MNNAMQQKLDNTLDAKASDLDLAPTTSFIAGFTACHDLLMPLLIEAMPHVMGSHGAEHMLDGFRPRRRPIDDLVERLQAVIPDTCHKCGGEMRTGIAIGQTLTGRPDFIGSSEVCTVSPGGSGRVIDCMKCTNCGWSVTK